MTTTLPTGQIKVGDILQAHGSRFLLIARLTDSRDGTNGFGAFTTEYLGPERAGCIEAIPACWRTASHPWVIQGNDLAFWTVELAA